MRCALRIVFFASLVSALAATPVLAQEPSGGAYEGPTETGPALTPAQRQQVWAEIRASRATLESAGILPSAEQRGPVLPPTLAWPLAPAAGYTDPGYHGVSNFVDHNAAFPNQLTDYTCGTRSYDTAGGYNHSGTDYFLWPFFWNMMDAGDVEIVAAAAGTIILKHDGEYDRSCAFNGNMWNAVYIQHADGSVAWYGHMKSGSTTAKLVGQTVVQGEKLGLVGSSGNSTGPHLHFELFDSGSSLVDPYTGTCNPISSWWASQRAYYDSALNRLMTGTAQPALNPCDNGSENASDTLPAGSTAYFTAFYHDQLSTQNSVYTIYRPDDSVFATWNHMSPIGHAPATLWTWSYGLPQAAPLGTWRFEVTYESVTTSYEFQVVQSLGVPALGTPGIVAVGALLLSSGLGAFALARRRSRRDA